jgi:hypothetical protein
MRHLFLSFIGMAALAACGGSSGDSANQPTINVTVTPETIALHAGDTAQLGAQASVTGLAPGKGAAVYVTVGFALQETDGGLLGAPVANGENFAVTYTAPAKAGVYHVVASAHPYSAVTSLITVNVN